MTSKTSKQIATHIADSAIDQGLTIKELGSYDLTPADIEYIRSAWEEGLAVDRVDILNIEALVRDIY